ncbi:hypothetical protein ZYGM_004906 [Zygosaccharomyces mellis]|uniref:Uncharacterized protein n=1 Tax=Zygosaccharomyces mellis TaxID=42258 RepID=A0A4C2E092_9SACH|nr:hypothetical protein ZYGM_004906 [Zygosaccharomyces mellis]
MRLTDQQRQDLKDKIIGQLNQRYEMTAQQVTKLEQNKLNDLDRAAQTQLDYNDSVSDGSLTVREILELEKKGTTTVD